MQPTLYAKEVAVIAWKRGAALFVCWFDGIVVASGILAVVLL